MEERELKNKLRIAILFTFMYFIDVSILAFAEETRFPDVVNYFNWITIPIFAILVIVFWCIYLERDFKGKYQKAKGNSKLKKGIPISISIIVLVILGRNIFWTAIDLVNYIIASIGYIDKIYIGVVIKTSIMLGWTIHWIYTLKNRDYIGGQHGIKLWKVVIWFCVIGLLLYAESTAGSYAYKMKEKECLVWRAEQYEMQIQKDYKQ